MQALRHWPFARVLLASVAWVLLCLLMMAAWIYVQVHQVFDPSTGSAGIGAVSVGVNALIPAIVFVPPVILTVAWLIMRRRRRSWR
jgi:hypothetical protein